MSKENKGNLLPVGSKVLLILSKLQDLTLQNSVEILVRYPMLNCNENLKINPVDRGSRSFLSQPIRGIGQKKYWSLISLPNSVFSL
jgi:hypothetical protein